MGAKTSSGNDVIMVLGKACHGQVSFDTATAVEQLGVSQLTRRTGHGIGADPFKSSTCILAAHFKFGERRLIKQPSMFTYVLVFFAYSFEPILTAHGIFIASG